MDQPHVTLILVWLAIIYVMIILPLIVARLAERQDAKKRIESRG